MHEEEYFPCFSIIQTMSGEKKNVPGSHCAHKKAQLKSHDKPTTEKRCVIRSSTGKMRIKNPPSVIASANLYFFTPVSQDKSDNFFS